MTRFLMAATFVAAMTISSCSGDTVTGPQTPESVTFASSLNINLSAMTRNSSGLYVRDLTVGTGAEAVKGKRLSMHYSGYLVSGALFDSNTGSSPFSFVLGSNTVIQGWEQGIIGMKVGGTRQLVIPAALGYGDAGIGPIPGGAVLVFTVDLLSVQ